MKEFDLYAALTDVDDRFVLEAAETETSPRSKWRGIQRAAIATIAAGVVAVVGITVGSALKNQAPTGNKTVKEDVSSTKRWADQPNYEKYSELTIICVISGQLIMRITHVLQKNGISSAKTS